MKNRIGHILKVSAAVVFLICLPLLLLTQCFVPVGSAELTLTIETDGNGSTEPSGAVTVAINQSIDIQAMPGPGYVFASWTVQDGTGVVIANETAASTTVTLTVSNATVRANFSLIEYTLTIGTTGDGSAAPTGTVTVGHGVPLTVIATPGAASAFTGWTVTAGAAGIADASAATTTVTLTSGDASVNAAFAVIPQLYVANYTDNTVSVVDGLDGTVPATIPVGTSPAAVGVNPVTGKVYIVHFDGETQVIDSSTNTVVATIPYSGSDYPSVAVDPSTNTVFAASQYDGDILVIDGGTDTLTGTFWNDYTNYDGTYPNGMAVNPVTGKLYISDWGDWDLWVYDAVTYAVIPTALTIRPDVEYGVAVNAVTNRVYAPGQTAASIDVLYIIDGSTDTEVTNITVGNTPTGVAVNTVTNTVYVTNQTDGTVSVVDGATNTVTTTVTVGATPLGVAVSENFNMVYVVNSGDNTVSFIDGASNAVVDTVTVGTNPQFIGVLE